MRVGVHRGKRNTPGGEYSRWAESEEGKHTANSDTK